MKALEWQRILRDLAEQHGKRLLTRPELANLTATRFGRLDSKEVSRLLKYRVLVRYAHGLYGLPGVSDFRLLIPHLDESAYVTGRYGLFLHGLLAQVPTEITCFALRGRNYRRRVQTALGPVRFSLVRPPVYRRPPDGIVATPEQCLCDWLFLVLREGRRPESLGTLSLGSIVDSRLSALLGDYPDSVRRCLKDLRGHTAS